MEKKKFIQMPTLGGMFAAWSVGFPFCIGILLGNHPFFEKFPASILWLLFFLMGVGIFGIFYLVYHQFKSSTNVSNT